MMLLTILAQSSSQRVATAILRGIGILLLIALALGVVFAFLWFLWEILKGMGNNPLVALGGFVVGFFLVGLIAAAITPSLARAAIAGLIGGVIFAMAWGAMWGES
jgi:hypothetical protein